MSDRAVQDTIIRALADAPFRASREWRLQELANQDRVDRFARFLARHFYHERLVHFFKYSRALVRVTGRTPEGVLTNSAFVALIPTLVLGSRASAVAVAQLVVDHVRGGTTAEIPYLDELLSYEQAMMVVESGARVWRDGTPDETNPKNQWSTPLRVEGTMLLDLTYDLPVVLPRLLQPWSEVPQPPRRQIRLLIARSKHGRVSVARTSTAIDTLLSLADGRRSLDDLAREAGLRPAELEGTLQGLVEIGAVRFSTGS
ncbi:MAG: hypothetical protein ACREMF_00745 [Gemmatimonadales bacterium]